VTATGEYFEFAPLDERIYWREIWLERVAEDGAKKPCSEERNVDPHMKESVRFT
jgi:hypothetical protein